VLNYKYVLFSLCEFRDLIHSILSPDDLLKSNALNLNGNTLRQLSNSNTATSRLVSEELLISSVHLGEVGHISKEDLFSVQSALASSIKPPQFSSVQSSIWERRNSR